MPWRKRAAEYRKKEAETYGELAREAIEGKNSGYDKYV